MAAKLAKAVENLGVQLILRKQRLAEFCGFRRHPLGKPTSPSPKSDINSCKTVILIAAKPFGIGFDVTVMPPSGGVGYDREFSTITAARIYALRLAKATGWSIVDASGVVR